MMLPSLGHGCGVGGISSVEDDAAGGRAQPGACP